MKLDEALEKQPRTDTHREAINRSTQPASLVWEFGEQANPRYVFFPDNHESMWKGIPYGASDLPEVERLLCSVANSGNQTLDPDAWELQ